MSQMQRSVLLILVAALVPAAWGQDATTVKAQMPEVTAYFHKGMEAQRDEQWDKAIEAFTQAIRLDPDYPPGYLQRGEIYGKLGRFDEAIADFSELIRRHPASSAYYHRGSMYLLTHKPELALTDAEEEIRQRPEQWLGYALRAKARLTLGDEVGVAADKAKVEDLKAHPPTSDASSAGNGNLRIGANVMVANLVHKVAPEYPDLAKQARIQGAVRFSVVVGKDGSVESLNLISGHPLLVDAAKTAVQQWQYKPTLLNGDPVRVATTVDVNFTLQE